MLRLRMYKPSLNPSKNKPLFKKYPEAGERERERESTARTPAPPMKRKNVEDRKRRRGGERKWARMLAVSPEDHTRKLTPVGMLVGRL